MKTLNLILLVGILVLSSCNKEENNNKNVKLTPQNGVNFNFYKNSKLYNEAQGLRSEKYSDAFEIEKVERIGNLLNIIVSYQDNCETNNFDIIWDGSIRESSPPQIMLNVKRTSSNCDLDTLLIDSKKDILSIDLVEFIGDMALVEGTIFYVSNLSKVPDQVNADISTVVINSDEILPSKYNGKWELFDISGGYSGDGHELDYDYLEIKNTGTYELRENDNLFEYGKIELDISPVEFTSMLPIKLIPEFFDGETPYFTSKKYINLKKTDTLELISPCCDMYNYHFKRVVE